MPNSSPRRIEILAFPDAQLLDVTGPAQVFATANDLTASPGGKLYEIRVVAQGDEVVTSSGLVLRTQRLPNDAACPDTLIIAGGYGVNAACKDDELVAWVRRRSWATRRTASVCSGAFLLAETGLLDGRRAVTHWHRCSEFAERFPTVKLDRDPIFVRDGPIWTSAGITAGIDLALAMVEEDQGRALALAAARQLVVFLRRPGGQSQFSATLLLQEAADRFEALHAWIADNLGGDLSLAALAEQTGMSLRSFCRHYRQSTGRTPAMAVETMRVEGARRLLEQGAPVQRAVVRCGFGSAETMRRAFLKHLGVGPNAYRERFFG
ncbi:Transcriptional regulator GlxA family, contains an amidase domain and an AraC-type DNA-binding HTH domain [Consotaella salsifontis]|uniref:Transcriptional regulator GlxA family, contains an amidase domain and an AraC-type DNA-binding HTH domain n=2 Tax=Consotaella salsifontis TaxID=1365950 RepID=A0A1T4SDJ4_9HYPH|nr:Transcriptional regulator GlxA family, contains an amidase domain and an AraC-type DNA-binding HTH domain [Consotaella salsifontis]